jgi:pyridoxal phosphate enzyme (YggS family)
MDPESLEKAHQKTLKRIQMACQASDRDGQSVALLAVSKTRNAQAVAALAALGQRAFGENYVSEGVDKISALADHTLTWHFIGPIQSNKTRLLAENFDWVQSVDRLKLVSRLNDQRPPSKPPLNVLIQVNLDGEDQKAGCAPDNILALANAIEAAPRLRLRGVMSIPAVRENAEDQRAVFAKLKALYDELQAHHPSIDTLSAGMSNDLEAAIAEGANLVRVGTALFGPRQNR